MPKIAEIIVTLPVDGRFYYSIPNSLDFPVEIGQRVLVPFGPRKVTGFVRNLLDEQPDDFKGRLKSIIQIMEEEPMLRPDLLELIRFAAEYYLEPEGEILRIAFPPGLTAASRLHYHVSAEGKLALAAGTLDSASAVLLRKAIKSRGLKKSKETASVIRKLLKQDYLVRKEQFSARLAEKNIVFIERTPQTTMPEFGRAQAQKSVYEAIGLDECRLQTLYEQLGKDRARTALKKLEDKGLIHRVFKRPQASAKSLSADSRNITLSEEQSSVLTPLIKQIQGQTHGAFLLRGVTGSGKTEVYLRAIEAVRAQGRGAIILVPEIALTSQLEARFRERFGDDVVVLHSALTDTERRRRWSDLYRQRAGIALGPRSAVWAPVHKLGVVIVDEEHDGSFKQHSDVRYHARDLALVRAHRADAVAILGSATPSLESRRHAKVGRITELRLASRYGSRPMPKVETVDLSTMGRDANGELPLITAPLNDALWDVVKNEQQAIIFLNRRGFNTVIVCEQCNSPRKCPACDVSLTHHKNSKVVVCHYCGRSEPLNMICGECGADAMLPYGAGTQRIASLIQSSIPGAKVIRLDRDITSKVGGLEQTLDAFRNQEANILVGTQMVAKGHDFPKVTLVGLICADSSLAFPDFRAAERTFQLVTQVAGRAGRAEHPGRVIIQTFQPQHYSLQCALAHDDDQFYEIEAASREHSKYPPFTRMGVIRIESKREDLAVRVSQDAAKIARGLRLTYELRVEGPVDAPIKRIRDRARRMIMLTAPKPAALVFAMRTIKRELGRLPSAVDVIFDVDAYDLL
jgi:primosomal protein N' (replication factor Y)